VDERANRVSNNTKITKMHAMCTVKSTIRGRCWSFSISCWIGVNVILGNFGKILLLRGLRVGYFRGPSTDTREAGFHYHVRSQSGREGGCREDNNRPPTSWWECAFNFKDILSSQTPHSLTNIDMYVCHEFPIAGWLAGCRSDVCKLPFRLLVPWQWASP
jgi:hypothetical protein